MKKTLIVCGMPRSATRMIANILNVDSRVLVTDEFPSGLTEKLASLTTAMNNFMSRAKYKDYSQWSIERISMIHSIWLANTLNKKKRLSDVEWIGNKTPSNELFFEFLEEAFNTTPHIIFIAFVRPKKSYHH